MEEIVDSVIHFRNEIIHCTLDNPVTFINIIDSGIPGSSNLTSRTQNTCNKQDKSLEKKVRKAKSGYWGIG